MEYRNLGNKTKIIKLMSNVGNYGLIIITCLSKDPLKIPTRLFFFEAGV